MVLNIMKVYIVGHKGWIAQMYIEQFDQMKIEYTYSDFRGESDEIKQDILKQKPSHILCCMGRTHGTFNGVEYNTIDYLENPGTLVENMNDNLYVPLSLALFAKEKSIHFTYMGTGCIFSYKDGIFSYEYDTNVLSTKALAGITESTNPNFFGSNYSIVKGYTDMLMRNTDALVLRIRMPITHKNHPRNFITKILNYKKICSMPNSMSVLDSLIPVSIEMMYAQEIGCYNFTNPGYIDHNSILVLYRNYIDPNFTWENFSIEEQSQVLKGARSNNILSTVKLEKYYKIDTIEEAMEKVFKTWVK